MQPIRKMAARRWPVMPERFTWPPRELGIIAQRDGFDSLRGYGAPSSALRKTTRHLGYSRRQPGVRRHRDSIATCARWRGFLRPDAVPPLQPGRAAGRPARTLLVRAASPPRSRDERGERRQRKGHRPSSDAWTQSECEEVVKDKKSVSLGRNACASRQAADDSEGSPLARPRPAAVISPSDVRDTRAVSACAHADSTLCKLVAPSGVIRALFPSGAAVAPFMHGGSGMFVLESPRLVACRLF